MRTSYKNTPNTTVSVIERKQIICLYYVQQHIYCQNIVSCIYVLDHMINFDKILFVVTQTLNLLCMVGSAATYMRFIPCIKKNYDYGVVIFLLTFNLLTVSSNRVDHHVLKIARDRFYTIVIGCGVCLLMSLLVFPNWSGEDLHNSTASKLEGLAKSLEGTYIKFIV